jgi:hypothetical protein
MPDARLKKGGAWLFALNAGPPALAKRPPTCVCPGEIGTHPRDRFPWSPGSYVTHAWSFQTVTSVMMVEMPAPLA